MKNSSTIIRKSLRRIALFIEGTKSRKAPQTTQACAYHRYYRSLRIRRGLRRASPAYSLGATPYLRVASRRFFFHQRAKLLKPLILRARTANATPRKKIPTIADVQSILVFPAHKF